MSDSLLYAAFTWLLTLASFVGSVRLLRHRRDVPWQVVLLWLVGTSLLALGAAIGATWLLVTGTLATGPVGAFIVALRAIATVFYVAIVIRFTLPFWIVRRVERWWLR